MDVSIIITYYNSRNHIKRCLDSALKTKGVSFEVILVDDNSTDTDKLFYSRIVKNKKTLVHYVKRHAGISHCRNIGASMATGEFLIFQDVDAKLSEKSIAYLIEPMQKDESIGATQAIFYKGKKQVETSGHFMSPFGLPYNYTRVSRKPEEIFGAQGVIAVRKKAFDSISGYDADHRLNGANTDLSWRIWLSGYRIVNSPLSQTYHYKQKEEGFTPRMYYRIYYEGPRTLLSMMLKNTSALASIWLVPACTLSWISISSKLLAEGSWKKAIWIYQGVWWNIIHLPKTMKKRARIRASAKKIPRTVFYGPLSPVQIIVKGTQWAKKVH